MNVDRLLALYGRVAEAPNVIPRLRRFVLDLAVRGKLGEQDPADEPASELLKRITAEKARLLTAGEIRKPRTVTPLNSDELPFPVPRGWAWTQIAKIGVIGPRNDAPDYHEASFVPMPMIFSSYGAANEHEPRAWGEIKKGYTHFAEGDVGLAKITPCFENGKSTVFRNLTGGIGSGTTELHIVRPLLVDADYILLFLKSPHFIKTGIPKMTGTAGQKRVPTEYFTASPFPLPPLAEQRRIVAKVEELTALLDRLEAARRQREATRDRLTAVSVARLNAPKMTAEELPTHARSALNALPALTARPDQIKQLRQTILNLAVRGKLVPQDPADEPASELLKRIGRDIADYIRGTRVRGTKAEKVSEDDWPFALPSGWVWTRLAELCRVVTDGDHQPPPRAEKGVAFLTIGNVTTGTLDFAGCRRVPPEYFDALPIYRTPVRGDLLYTVVGATFGRPVLVDSEEPFCVQRHIAILKPSGEAYVPYLHRILASPFVYDQAAAATTGTAQPTVALKPLRNFLIPLPPLAEQHRIVAKVDALMALCARLEAALATANATRQRLLESLLHEALEPAMERKMEAAE